MKEKIEDQLKLQKGYDQHLIPSTTQVVSVEIETEISMPGDRDRFCQTKENDEDLLDTTLSLVCSLKHPSFTLNLSS